MAKRVVKKTRNNGEWSEAKYWGMVRSILRRGFRWWKPIVQCKINARRKYQGNNKRMKWEYQCNYCKNWFKDKDVQVDHITPVGSLRCSEDLAGFLERLTAEGDNSYQVLCKDCHKNIKTPKDREEMKKARSLDKQK